MALGALKALIKSLLVRLGLRPPNDASNESEYDLDELPKNPSKLIEELGLIADLRPVRERAGWQQPSHILVTEVSERRLQWLHEVAPGVRLSRISWAGDMAAAARDADAIIGWCTPEMLAAGKKIRWIQVGIAGIETILRMPELSRRDILVTNLQRAAGPVIAEHAFAMLLSLARRLSEHLNSQRRHKWQPGAVNPCDLISLRGRTMLVAGLGGIGTEIAKIGHYFGMHVIATRTGSRPAPFFVARIGKPEDLANYVRDADVVINALPLTSNTARIFDAEIFDAMKQGALFVNIARGPSVVTEDLVRALNTGKLAGAALDVVEPEPLPSRHPLWRMKNVIITPHVAGWGRDTRAREWQIIRENLRRYVAGEPMLSVVDIKRGY